MVLLIRFSIVTSVTEQSEGKSLPDTLLTNVQQTTTTHLSNLNQLYLGETDNYFAKAQNLGI